MKLLTDTYKEKTIFALSCYDRLVFSGTLPEISYAQGMTSYLYCKDVRIFDYPRFAERFKEKIRNHAESIAREHNLKIEFIRKSGIRKEAVIAEKIKQMVLIPAYCY